MKLIFLKRKKAWLALLAFLAGRAAQLHANPTGLTVSSGQASLQQIGQQLNIAVSQAAILNWQSFNIGKGETTSFLQPSANSIVFNVIGDKNPSQIFGNLNANGTVILANANGFYFGPDSMIKVGGSFIATTAPITPDFGSGALWQFTGMPPLASIVNYGKIEVGHGRSLFLIAEKIENYGRLTAPEGSVDLVAGQSVLISETPDGRGLAAQVTLPAGSVDNFGRITADAGTIALQAKVVNQNGLLQADSIQNKNGVIELIASDVISLGAGSQILARGDDSIGGSAGGKVTIKSDNVFTDVSGSLIVTTGGANGGHGGDVEVSAPNIQSLETAMDARAKAGWLAGEFLLDPANIILGTTGAGTVPNNGTVPYNTSGTLSLNVNTAFANKNFSNIKLQATQNITLNANTAWDLSASTGQTTGQLTLQAGGDIIFNNGAKIFDANNWSVSLQAGYNFSGQSVVAGGNKFSIGGTDVYLGNIYLNGGSGKTLNGTIQTAGGSINLEAGLNVLVGSGSIYTTAGGSISAHALAGDINCGTANGGYEFKIFGYSPVSVLGGISTAAGGDVSLVAGNNITSISTVPSGQLPGASGAYGAGNVTLIAGNQILGNYTLANGVGTILAGATLQNGLPVIQNSAASIGTSQRPVNLSLINGSWNAYSGGDIFIGEVRNPNGTFNGKKRPVIGDWTGNGDGTEVPTQIEFAFDYAANAAVNFWAGNLIELVGSNLPRVTGQNQAMPPIYAPNLSLNAGAGGIKIDNSIVLFPSKQGSLSITTRDGGNLVGAASAVGLTGITMSDSGLPGWATFLLGHAITPLHLNDANPVRLDIAGDIRSFSLAVPTFANINIGGNTYNFGFSGRNLSTAQTTSINVGGDITYRGNLTSVSLSDALPAALLTDSANPAVTSKLFYDAKTGKLTFVGVMSATDLAFLLDPSVIAYDKSGFPEVDADGNQVTTKLTLSAAQLAAFNNLYTATQDATLGDNGLLLAGPGKFNIRADNIDLGISGGIAVIAPDAALANVSPYGAALSVTTLGNLSLTSTKIANESLLGDIFLDVGGTLDVGGQFTTFGDVNAPKGIFTTSSGSLDIVANDDVNVNSSRIAAYNGGNITVESRNGDINAGSGGAGFVSMNALELDPVTGRLVSIPASIPGSGILATTLTGSHANLGNILLETPNGDISASVGGVIQISFNSSDPSGKTAMLLAGYELRDASGANRLTASDFVDGAKVADSSNPSSPFTFLDANGQLLGRIAYVSPQRKIDASGSGLIAQNIIVKATGEVSGLFVGRTIDVTTPRFGTGPTVFYSADPPKISDGKGGQPPSDFGPAPVVVSSDGSTAAPPPEAAKAVVQSESSETTTTKLAEDETDETKKKKGIGLAAKVSRVTVILPSSKKLSQAENPQIKL